MSRPHLLTTYTDALGVERSSPSWTVDHVQEVLAEPRGIGGLEDVLRVRAGAPAGALRGRELRLEDGGTVAVTHAIPADLPLGYHRLDGEGGEILVLHAPAVVPAPVERGWVVAAQLYSARSLDSWGHGDLRDARRIAGWIEAGGGDGHLMLNPLHAAIPGPHPQPSPYFASSRVFRNPLYLCVEEVPGADALDLRPWAAEAEATDASRMVDRSTAWRDKRAALAAVWAQRRTDPPTIAAIDAFLADPIHRAYAAFCVAAEANDGQPPSARPTSFGPASDEERFHAWLQVLLEEQLLGVEGRLVHDVAVGTDRAGADTWLWPDCYVLDGTRIGCPPDQFNTKGQDWGLPPFHPLGLRAAGYEPFVRAVRSALVGAAGVRLDHVMGLERLFWIPEAGAPPDGVYVGYELEELLDVVAIESHRAGAFVVGEDLGTVPPSVRTALPERGILSYRVMSLDPEPPATYPRRCMAAVTTHDLATTIGLLTGQDLRDQADLDLEPNVEDTEAAVQRVLAWAGTAADDPAAPLALHRLLAGSPAALVTTTLEDLAGMVERPNMPGTIDEWPNWRWGLPRPLDAVLEDDEAQAIRAVLARR